MPDSIAFISVDPRVVLVMVYMDEFTFHSSIYNSALHEQRTKKHVNHFWAQTGFTEGSLGLLSLFFSVFFLALSFVLVFFPDIYCITWSLEMKKKPLNVGYSKQSNKVKTHLNHNMQSEYQAKQYKKKSIIHPTKFSLNCLFPIHTIRVSLLYYTLKQG